MTSRKRLIIGLVSGILAMVLVLAYVSSVRAEEKEARAEALVRYGGEQVEVCVARSDILPGEQIEASDVVKVAWLADLLPQDTATSTEDVVGQVAKSEILANEPISLERLEGSLLEITVPAGLCAVSVPTQDVRAVGGAIDSGSLVDVYAYANGNMVLLGSDLLVLATSQSAATKGAHASSLSWVTLAVAPESVQELLAASTGGNLYLVLPGAQTPTAEGISVGDSTAQVVASSSQAVIDPVAGMVADGAGAAVSAAGVTTDAAGMADDGINGADVMATVSVTASVGGA